MNIDKPLIEVTQELVESAIKLSIPEQFRRGSRKKDEVWSINSGVANLNGIAQRIGKNDWSDQNILDFGCGVKFTQALIQYDVKIGNYVGMDVYKGLIDVLKDKVKKNNFQFYHVPFENKMYNPSEIKLTKDASLPGDIKQYDILTLQSVFTHFSPDDFQSMLHVLRRYAAPNARMLFTCFIDNAMEEDFLDAEPDRPLLNAVYKEDFIRMMLKKSGWDIISLSPKSFMMSDHFTCKPA